VSDLLKNLKSKFGTPMARQTYMLYASQLLQMLFGALAYILLSANLSKETFGDREIVVRLTTFFLSFFELGFFFSGARLLANQREKAKERKLVSALIFIGGILCFIYALFLMAIAPLVQMLFNTHQDISQVLIWFAFPFSLSLYLFVFFQFIYQGTNEILKLSFLNVAFRFGHVALLLLWLNFEPLTLESALMLYSVSIVGVVVVLVAKAKPSWKAFRENWQEIRAEVMTYGRYAFVGYFIGQACGNLDTMFLGTFFNSTAVGVYAVALFYVAPISAFADAYTAVAFKRLAQETLMPKKIYQVNMIGLLGLAGVYVVLGVPLFKIIFPKYADDAFLIYPLTLAMVILGLSKPYNAFFRAKGDGKAFQRATLIYAVTSAINYLWAIPLFSVTGAAIAAIASSSVNYIVHRYFYRALVINHKTVEDEILS
jgi:O-antigen/teichoic acid export membrane protein